MVETGEGLYEASLQMGFNLEFKTYIKIKECYAEKNKKEVGSLTNILDVNHRFTSFDGALTEVDVYGHFLNPHSSFGLIDHYLVECKGTSTSSKLLLVEKMRSSYLINGSYKSYSSIEINYDKGSSYCVEGLKLQPSSFECFDVNPDEGPFEVFTGDFFKLERINKFTGVGKNESKNNFFKGINQLNDAAYALCGNRNTCMRAGFPDPHRSISRVFTKPGYRHLLHPIIVTNAEIWVVNYESQNCRKVPWAIYRNNVSTYDIQTLGYMPFINVVSVEHIADYLESTDLKYHSDWDYGEYQKPE